MTRLVPRQLVDTPSVLVAGPAAVALSSFLRRYRREWCEHAAPFAVSIEVAETVAALEMVADAFRRVPIAEPLSVPIAEPGLPLPGVMTTTEAAGQRGVSERWIRRQLETGRLPGRKVAGRWLVEDVET